jgi:hypothetical protein
VLENPTCRWSTYACKRIGLDPFRPDECKQQLAKYSGTTPPATPANPSPVSPHDLFLPCCTMQPGPVVQPTQIPRVAQQRAWTSPIWYRPAEGGRR